jgi:AraC-like DNA-binding protein
MSHSTLYRKIKAITHMTTNEFIRNIRLKRAAQLLHTPGINVSEVTYQVGFTNLSYFGKKFHSLFGLTPTEYMKKYQESDFSS